MYCVMASYLLSKMKLLIGKFKREWRIMLSIQMVLKYRGKIRSRDTSIIEKGRKIYGMKKTMKILCLILK